MYLYVCSHKRLKCAFETRVLYFIETQVFYFIVATILIFFFRIASGQEVCMLCGNDGGKMYVVGGKGLNTIIGASIKKQENDIHEKLTRLQQSQCPVYVHHDCRRRFVDLQKKSNSLPQQK